MRFGWTERLVLVVGDGVVLVATLWATLAIRYVETPSVALFSAHLVPFSFLFALWIFIFFIAGLYEKHTSLFERELPGTILTAQIVNVVGAALFFFLLPGFGIAPKTNLLIYLGISSAAVITWRLWVYPRLDRREPRGAVIVGSGKELVEMTDELSRSPRFHLKPILVVDVAKSANPNDIQGPVLQKTLGGEASVVVVDTHGRYGDLMVPLFYNLSFAQSGVEVIAFGKLYEDMFDKIPLSHVPHSAGDELSGSRSLVYEAGKRVVDIALALIVLGFLLIITPFVYVALSLEGPGPLFIRQERVGRHGRRIVVYKFRTMTQSENGAWIGETKNRITAVGAVLRQASIDELPQVFSIIAGDLSFIGPRSDVTGLATRLAESIPFYNARYRVTPGISGWAQINQRYTPGNISPQSIEESRIRLAYDLYYVKNRSFLLDIAIALRTIKTLILRIIPHG